MNTTLYALRVLLGALLVIPALFILFVLALVLLPIILLLTSAVLSYFMTTTPFRIMGFETFDAFDQYVEFIDWCCNAFLSTARALSSFIGPFFEAD